MAGRDSEELFIKLILSCWHFHVEKLSNYPYIYHMACFQNESGHLYTENTFFALCLHSHIEKAKLQMRFLHYAFFSLKSCFCNIFLAIFGRIEWNLRILKTYRGKEISLNILIFFYSTKFEISSHFLCFSQKKWFKMYYATKVKTLLYVSSFVCLLCVCNFLLHLKKRF